MEFHPNYIEELKDQFKDQEYKGSEWEKADKSLFNHYTETHYKVCSLPDKTKWVTEKVNWGLESEQWDDFDPDKVKIWESDEIGEKFEGIITCYGIDFDFRDKSQISDREKEMIDKINNNHYDFDEWVDFEMDQGADMVERDYKFLEMKLGTDETNSFFPILKFLDKNANKYDDHWGKADNEYSYSYINDMTLPLFGHWTGVMDDYASSTNCKDVLFLHPISGEWEKVSLTYFYNHANCGLAYEGPASLFDHIDRIKKYGKK